MKKLKDKKTLDELLDIWVVIPPNMWENDLKNSIIKDWYAVANDEGIVAYFGEEKDACKFRVGKIEKELKRKIVW